MFESRFRTVLLPKRVSSIIRRRMGLRVLIGLAMGSSLVGTGSVEAANRFWITSGGGAFGTPGAASANWSTTNGGVGGATAPSTTDVANFPISGVYAVTFSQNVTNDSLDVDNGSVTFSLGGNTYTVTNTGQSVRIGDTAGQTGRFTISNGTLQADDTIIGTLSATAAGTLTVSTGTVWNDTQMIVGDLGNGSLTIQNGGDVNESLDVTIGDDLSGVGTASINGVGSTWNVTRFLNVGAGGSGSLDVFSGGAVTGQTIRIAAIAGTGNAIVRGTGSTLTSTGTLGLTVGGTDSAAGGTGVLSIETGAAVSISNASGELRLWPAGTANLNGGSLSLPDFEFRGGVFNFNSGTLTYTGSKTFTASDISRVLGNNATLAPGRTLNVVSTATIQSPLIIDGGTLNVATLANQSTLALKSGNLIVFGAGGLNLGTAGVPLLSVPAGANVGVNQALTVAAGNQLTLSGNVTAGTVTNNVGGRIVLDGLSARLTSAGTLTNNGLIHGEGVIAASLTNGGGGEIEPFAGGRLAFTGPANSNNGEIHLGSGEIEFANALGNSVSGFIDGRGSLATGGLTNDGTLAFSGGFTDVYGDVTNNGTGQIVVSGGNTTTFYDDMTQNGLFRVSKVGGTTSVAVILGAFSGSGGSTGGGDIFFEGDLRPGNSPATITLANNVNFGSSATLDIELGGIAPGTQYDQVHVTGALALDGTLQVSLVSSFSPALGDEFDILDWGTLSGAFSSISLPTLTGALTWNTDALYSEGILSVVASLHPGDFDSDGDVDGADFVIWQTNFPAASGHTLATGDADGDGDVDGADFVVWQTNFPFTPGPGVSPVPEPQSIVLVLLALAATLPRRYRKRLLHEAFG